MTGAEAAKMLLVAAGYDPAIEGFVGTDWAINTNAKASSLGIFRNFTKNIMLPLSRDDAALLIYNALDVEMIQKYENGYAIAYTDHRTILSAMYGVYKVEGVVVANKWAELDQTDSDAALKAGKTTLDNVVLYASTTASTTTGEGKGVCPARSVLQHGHHASRPWARPSPCTSRRPPSSPTPRSWACP